MRRCATRLILVLALWPGALWACAYPIPLRDANTALAAALDRGGQVDVHLRMALRRTLDGTSVVALQDAMRGEVSRAQLRSVRAVLAKATALARGEGQRVPGSLQADMVAIAEAVDAQCAGAQIGEEGGPTAETIERGVTRRESGTERALTFRDGVTRLSYTFTIYMAFLAFLLGVRRAVHRKLAARLDTENSLREGPPQVPSRRQT